MLILTDIQKVSLNVSPKSAAGNPAEVDGIPAWNSSDESVITLVPSDDGLSVDAITTGKIGTSQISVSVDADLGSGIRTITGVLDIEVRPSEAVTLDINAGVPSDK